MGLKRLSWNLEIIKSGSNLHVDVDICFHLDTVLLILILYHKEFSKDICAEICQL